MIVPLAARSGGASSPRSAVDPSSSSRDVAVPRLRRTLVAPCTTTIRGLASEVALEPVPRACVANLDSVESVSIGVLVERLGRLADTKVNEICIPLGTAVDCR